jgi:hypothetical protein
VSDMTLYQRGAAILATLDAIIEAEGEITPEQEAELDASRASFADKVEACLAKRQELRATADACTEEAVRLSQRARTLEARAEWLERYVLTQMTLTDTKSVQGSRFTATRTLNPPKVVAVTMDAPTMRADLAALPDALRECVKVIPPSAESYTWDKAKLLTLAKTSPDAVAGVAIIDRTERLKVS